MEPILLIEPQKIYADAIWKFGDVTQRMKTNLMARVMRKSKRTNSVSLIIIKTWYLCYVI